MYRFDLYADDINFCIKLLIIPLSFLSISICIMFEFNKSNILRELLKEQKKNKKKKLDNIETPI